MVNELVQPTSLNELKRYLELRGRLFPQNGLIEKIDTGEFAGFQAVTSNFTHRGKVDYGRRWIREGEDGVEGEVDRINKGRLPLQDHNECSRIRRGQ